MSVVVSRTRYTVLASLGEHSVGQQLLIVQVKYSLSWYVFSFLKNVFCGEGSYKGIPGWKI